MHARQIFTTTFLGAALATTLPAQNQRPAQIDATTPASAAERAFRDAWWAESGAGDLDTALKGYLAASHADGPAPTRARALLHAGAVQQRLGKHDAALATFRQVLRDHADQQDVVAKARTHLRELTAVDLRDSYDEWYERRLFSEDVQSEILGLVQRLAGKIGPEPTDDAEAKQRAREIGALVGEILAFGKGAVPALLRASESGQVALAERAVEMLMILDVMPSERAFARTSRWADDAQVWAKLLASGPSKRMAWVVSEPEPPHRAMLRATSRSAAELLAAIVAIDDAALVTEEPTSIAAATNALLRRADARPATLAAMTGAETPLRIRKAMEHALLGDHPSVPMTVAEWLLVGADPTLFDLRCIALAHVARQLRMNDGDALDECLRRIEAVPLAARSSLLERFVQGLEISIAPLHVPWTAERLTRLLKLVSRADATLAIVFGELRRNATTRTLVADAVFTDPVALWKVYDPDADDGARELSESFSLDGFDEREAQVVNAAWVGVVVERLKVVFDGRDDARILAALAITRRVVHGEVSTQAPLVAFLRTRLEGASGPVRERLVEMIDELGN